MAVHINILNGGNITIGNGGGGSPTPPAPVVATLTSVMSEGDEPGEVNNLSDFEFTGTNLDIDGSPLRITLNNGSQSEGDWMSSVSTEYFDAEHSTSTKLVVKYTAWNHFRNNGSIGEDG